jgi:Zn-dependent protease with chaperone function
MKYYMVRREWSQTDQDNIIIRAESKEMIERFYKEQKHGPRYITVYPTEEPNIFELTEKGLKRV